MATSSSTYDTAVLLRTLQGEQNLYQFFDTQILRVDASSVASTAQCTVQMNGSLNQHIDYSALSSGVSWLARTTVTSALGAAPDATTVVPVNIWSPKICGYLAYIDKVAITINNASVGSSSEGLSIFNWLRYIRSASENFHHKVASLLGMGLDLTDDLEAWIDTHNYTNTTALSIANTIRPAPQYCPRTDSQTANAVASGVAMFASGNSCISNKSAMIRSSNVSSVNAGTDSARNAMNRNTYTINYTGNNIQIDYDTYMYLPLCMLHDVFAQLGVVNGLSIKLTLYFSDVTSCTSISDTNNAFPGSSAVAINARGTVAPFNVHETGASLAPAGYPGIVTGNIPTTANVGSLAVAEFKTADVGSPGAMRAKVSVRSATTEVPAVYLQQVMPFESNAEAFEDRDIEVRYNDFQVYFQDFTNSAINWTINPSASGVRRISLLGFRGINATTEAVNAEFSVASHTPYMSSPCFILNDPKLQVSNAIINILPLDNNNRDFAQNCLIYGAGGGQDQSVSSGLYTKRCYDLSRIYMADLTHYTLGNTPAGITLKATAVGVGVANGGYPSLRL
ncbi:MAG: hypothetical protein ACK5DE_08460, partial [Bacteroidota bacterium]